VAQSAESPSAAPPATQPDRATTAQISAFVVPANSGISPQRIVLTGFMGAGKSTVGRLLARQLDWRFIDVDDQIEATAGASIAELFRAHGEPWFRELEHQTIRQLAGEDQLVLGLGGGAIEDPRTRTLLLATEGTRLVHLEATLETVLLRCRGTENIRPILADRLNLEARYQRRLPLYRLAHLTLNVDNLSPEAAANALLEKIGLPTRP